MAAVILLPALFLAALALFAACWVLTGMLALPKRASLDHARETEIRSGLFGDYDALPKEAYTVSSFDGYTLHAVFVPAAQENGRLVILSHGYGYNHLGSVKYMHMYRRMGYSCILYDARGFGENRPAPCTMGFLEHRDLLCVIDDARRRFGKNVAIGLHGESMGSALSLMAIGENPDVRFLVADCGYSDLKTLLAQIIRRDYHLPAWLLRPASALCRLRFGYRIEDVSPVRALKNSRIPVLIIHGEADNFIVPSHAQTLYDQAPQKKALFFVRGAMHAGAYGRDPQGYAAQVRAFLDSL